jgi:hypothetical protein
MNLVFRHDYPEDIPGDNYPEDGWDEEEDERPTKQKGPARRKSRAERKKASRLNKI